MAQQDMLQSLLRSPSQSCYGQGGVSYVYNLLISCLAGEKLPLLLRLL